MRRSLGRRVAIVGAALSDIGRVDDKTPFELIQQASSRALDDAGLTKADVDGFASTGTGQLAPIEAAEYLGLDPRWVDGTPVGGSTWLFMAAHAATAIAAGLVDVVLIAYGSTTRSDLKKRIRETSGVVLGRRGPAQFEAPLGLTLISRYAMAAQRHMHQYGTTLEQLAEIAVSARYNAGLNPDAYYREPITVDEINSGPVLASPFTKGHCCIRSDGGGAIVLASEDRVSDTAKRPIWILGTGESLSHTTMCAWDDFTESPCTRSGRDAFSRAGLSPADVDVCELYDSFTSTVLLTLEGLGFCQKGEGGDFVSDGRLRVGGSLPTNTDGGGLSHCHPGMRGMFLLVEATRQLRGEAGERQVAGAEVACANGTGGWFSSSATILLGRG